jgi:hypothetical protein
MVSPAASCPRTALTVTRVSRMQGRPLIRFGSIQIRSYATPEAPAYSDRRHLRQPLIAVMWLACVCGSGPLGKFFHLLAEY